MNTPLCAKASAFGSVAPAQLSDNKVLTMEIVGEFLDIDTDQDLYTYFRRHFADWFPTLRQIDHTTFTCQAANLWVIKEQLFVHLCQCVPMIR